MESKNKSKEKLSIKENEPAILRLYGRVGFLPLGKPYTYLGKSGKRYTENDGMVAQVKSKDIFDFITKDEEPFDIGNGNW